MKDDKTRCKRCHRIIVTPEARQRGYGDICWKKFLEERQSKNSLFQLQEKEAK